MQNELTGTMILLTLAISDKPFNIFLIYFYVCVIWCVCLKWSALVISLSLSVHSALKLPLTLISPILTQTMWTVYIWVTVCVSSKVDAEKAPIVLNLLVSKLHEVCLLHMLEQADCKRLGK